MEYKKDKENVLNESFKGEIAYTFAIVMVTVKNYKILHYHCEKNIKRGWCEGN